MLQFSRYEHSCFYYVFCYFCSSDFKILKGKRALDIVSKCFLSGTADSHRHLHSTLLQTNFLPYFAHCDRYNYVPRCTHKEHISADTQALFPPGRFTSLSVVVIPYPRDTSSKSKAGGGGGQSNGLFIKVFKKLEKAGFDILSVSTSVMDSAMATSCQEHVLLSQASYGCSYDYQMTQTEEWFRGLVGHAVLSVVVAGNSALLRLLPVVGPFDTHLAEERYPLSISASLHVPASRDNSTALHVFQSTTVAATDMMLQMFANHKYSTSDLLEAAQSASSVKNLLSDFGSMEYSTYQERYDSPPKPGSSGGSGCVGGVENEVFRGLRELSLAEHAAWVHRQSGATYTIGTPLKALSILVLT